MTAPLRPYNSTLQPQLRTVFSMSHPTIRGSLVALITPFNEDGSVNFDKLGQLIDFHLANSTDALVILGTTGESSTMSHEEDNAVCEYTVKRVAGRIPVIAGSGSNSTQTMLEKSLSYERLGADGLLLITPYYNKTNEEGMYLHFKTVADAVKIPCILYNVPGRTAAPFPWRMSHASRSTPTLWASRKRAAICLMPPRSQSTSRTISPCIRATTT